MYHAYTAHKTSKLDMDALHGSMKLSSGDNKLMIRPALGNVCSLFLTPDVVLVEPNVLPESKIIPYIP